MLTPAQQAVLFVVVSTDDQWRKLRRLWAMDKYREANVEKVRRRAREHARLPESRKVAESWAARNPAKIQAAKRRYRQSERGQRRQKEERLQMFYGLTLLEFEQRLQSQEGVCAICVSRPATDVDHNHATGRVRELLCNNCNRGLGHFKESPEAMRRAAEYLERHAPS